MPLGRVAEFEHLVVGHPAGPGHEIGARLEPLGLLPDRKIRLLKHLVGVGPVDHKRADKRIEPPLRGSQQGHELIAVERGHKSRRMVER